MAKRVYTNLWRGKNEFPSYIDEKKKFINLNWPKFTNYEIFKKKNESILKL